MFEKPQKIYTENLHKKSTQKFIQKKTSKKMPKESKEDSQRIQHKNARKQKAP
jgi:hypothetical protein